MRIKIVVSLIVLIIVVAVGLFFVPVLTLEGHGSVSGLRTRCQVNLFGMKHGAYAEQEPSGATVLVGHFFLGRYAGTWKWYGAEDKVVAECHYESSPVLCQAFFDSGEVKEKSYSVRGKMRHFSDLMFNAEFSEIERAYRAGVLTGEYRQFYRSGEVKVMGDYENGSPHGTWKFLRKSGKVRMTKEYAGELDELTITTKTYFENGNVASQSMEGSSLAVKNRADILFYESKRPFFKMKLSGGIPQEIAFYDPSGASIAYCETDEFGLYCGLDSEAGTGSTKKVQAYFKGGITALDIDLDGGRLSGRLTRFYENGKTASYLTFHHGMLDGEAAYFDEQGRLEAVKQFKQWKLVAAEYYDTDGGTISYPEA